MIGIGSCSILVEFGKTYTEGRLDDTSIASVYRQSTGSECKVNFKARKCWKKRKSNLTEIGMGN